MVLSKQFLLAACFLLLQSNFASAHHKTRADLCHADAAISGNIMRARQDGISYETVTKQLKKGVKGDPVSVARARTVALSFAQEAYAMPIRKSQMEKDAAVTSAYQIAFEACLQSNL